jgi:glucose/mannose transport system substrate-binding protein
MKTRKALAATLFAAVALPAAASSSLEVLHFWTSGGEAAALNVLKKKLEGKGVAWKDMPVAGGGGEAAMTTLRTRLASGNPPAAVSLMGFDLVDWSKQGVLADLNGLATAQGWDKTVPAAVQRFSKYNGKWVAAPINIHAINWVWANKAVLDKAGVSTEPKSWNEFIAAAEKVRQAGFIAIAHGGQPWQEATIFDGVVLATGGADYYRKAFVDLDAAALNSPTTLEVFKRMRQLRGLVDKDFSGRDWNVASGMVISGKAGFQIMGDWAKGEFVAAGKQAGRDYLCFPLPGTQGQMSFLSNQFAMFKVKAEQAPAQAAMATLIMDPALQSEFNVLKGSMPARTGVPDTAFDACGKRDIQELAEATRRNTLVGSIAHGHAVPTAIKNAFYDVITRHFNGQIDDKQAVSELAAAARN